MFRKRNMKLCRIGSVGEEKPAIIDSENNYRDLSSIINDLNPDTLNFDTLEKIKKTDISSLPKLDSSSRIGACVSNPSKFIGIGLNFKDHAEEQNLPLIMGIYNVGSLDKAEKLLLNKGFHQIGGTYYNGINR